MCRMSIQQLEVSVIEIALKPFQTTGRKRARQFLVKTHVNRAEHTIAHIVESTSLGWYHFKDVHGKWLLVQAVFHPGQHMLSFHQH